MTDDGTCAACASRRYMSSGMLPRVRPREQFDADVCLVARGMPRGFTRLPSPRPRPPEPARIEGMPLTPHRRRFAMFSRRAAVAVAIAAAATRCCPRYAAIALQEGSGASAVYVAAAWRQRCSRCRGAPPE